MRYIRKEPSDNLHRPKDAWLSLAWNELELDEERVFELIVRPCRAGEGGFIAICMHRAALLSLASFVHPSAPMKRCQQRFSLPVKIKGMAQCMIYLCKGILFACFA
jgi:hypothetical protein